MKLNNNYIKFILLIFILCGTNFLLARQLEDILSEILENNQELKAISAMNKLEILNAKNELLPENPALEQEFHENDNYEIGITQSFQFPTFYYHQYKNLQMTKAQQEAIYKATKVRILEEAKINLYSLNYLLNQIRIQKKRLEDANQLTSHFEKLLTQGEITQLELNQAKIHQVSYDNSLRDLLIQKAEVSETLKMLNGGIEVESHVIQYQEPTLEIESLKEDFLQNNPDLAIETINQQIAARNTKIAKYEWLPYFRIGVHKGKESDPMLHYGISIPLWKNRNRIKRAKAVQLYNNANLEYTTQSVASEFNKLASEYKLLQQKLQQNLKLHLNSHELLEKSLEVGEISSIEYFTEIENLYEFEDHISKTNLDLEIVKVKLTSFKF
ncbi:MAG: TolC family protein [Candidatus Marinimicrobia bacterium]|nr:TolC family protein [Candidatus Neomarinimicrobiota bacterium]